MVVGARGFESPTSCSQSQNLSIEDLEMPVVSRFIIQGPYVLAKNLSKITQVTLTKYEMFYRKIIQIF